MTATKRKVVEAHTTKVSKNRRDKNVLSNNDAPRGGAIGILGQPVKNRAGTFLQAGLEESGSEEAEEPDDQRKRRQCTLYFVRSYGGSDCC